MCVEARHRWQPGWRQHKSVGWYRGRPMRDGASSQLLTPSRNVWKGVVFKLLFRGARSGERQPLVSEANEALEMFARVEQ